MQALLPGKEKLGVNDLTCVSGSAGVDRAVKR